MSRKPSILINLALLLLLGILPACSKASPTPQPTATLSPPVYLSTLTPVSASVGYGELGVGVYALPDPIYDGQPLFAQGQAWPHGLMTHAPALVAYRLDGGYRLFRSALLSKESFICGDGVRFQVLLDGRKVYTSPSVTAFSAPLQVELDVSGAQELTLVVDSLQTSDCDWAMWGDPRLLSSAGVPQGYPTATTRPTMTSDPSLPCNGSQPERTYLFLDCEDVRRIRTGIESGDSELLLDWNALVANVDNYRASFPTSYNPNNSADTLWWGPGNYIAANLALIYLVTGDRAYARDILRLLELVSSQTPQVKELTNFDAPTSDGLYNAGGLFSYPPLGEGPFQSLLFAFFTVREDAFLDTAQREAYDTFFQKQALLLEEAAIQRDNHSAPDSSSNRNVPIGANISALTIAAAYPDDPEMQALAARVRPIFDWQMATLWEPDGGWGEHTNQYGFRVFRAILYLAETLLHNGGGDLYQADFGGVSIHSLCQYWLAVVTPEGDPPSINDTGFGYFEPGSLMLCARRTDDPQLNFAAAQYLWGYRHAFGTNYTQFIAPTESVLWWDSPELAGPSAPDWTSVLLPDTGLGILRSDWSHDAQYGLLKFTSSLVHTHFSFGEFFLYDHGPWLVGSGYHLGELSNPSAATRSASTLTLDDARQAVPGGELVLFEPFTRTAAMAVSAHSYASLDHTRTVLWLPGYHQWLVVDDAVMDDPTGHKVQVRWYVRGQENADDPAGAWTFTRPDTPGTLVIQMPSALTPTYTPIQRAFEDDPGDAIGVEIEVRPEKHTRILTSLAYIDSPFAGYPVVSRDDSGNGLRITTQPSPGAPVWEWLLAAPGSRAAASGDLRLDGRIGCTWTNAGTLAGYCLYSGGGLVSGELNLVESSAPLSLEADFDGGQIMLDASAETRLRVYWPADVASITEAGKPVPFQQSDGLLFLELTAGKHTLVITSK